MNGCIKPSVHLKAKLNIKYSFFTNFQLLDLKIGFLVTDSVKHLQCRTHYLCNDMTLRFTIYKNIIKQLLIKIL